MDKIYCSHCGLEVDKSILICPKCNAPMLAKTENRAEKNAKKFKYYFIALVIFCFVVIYVAPRVILGS